MKRIFFFRKVFFIPFQMNISYTAVLLGEKFAYNNQDLTITPPPPLPQQQTHNEGFDIFYLCYVTIQSTDDRELSMKMGDEILSKLLDKSDVLELDEDTLAEHLLFIIMQGPILQV